MELPNAIHGEVHFIFHPHGYRGNTFRSTANHRHKNDPDICGSHSQLFPGTFSSTYQDLTHKRCRYIGCDQNSNSS